MKSKKWERRGNQDIKKERKKITNETVSMILRRGVIRASVLCSSKSESTKTYILQSATEGGFVSKDDIISYHPDAPAKKNEDVHGKNNI